MNKKFDYIFSLLLASTIIILFCLSLAVTIVFPIKWLFMFFFNKLMWNGFMSIFATIIIYITCIFFILFIINYCFPKLEPKK